MLSIIVLCNKMFCSNCGVAVMNDDNFCSTCGNGESINITDVIIINVVCCVGNVEIQIEILKGC